MQQNATLTGEPGDLMPRQERVVAALLAGSTVTHAAELARVDRSTVHRWLRSDWNFQATLNRARREFRDGLRASLESVGEIAVQKVREAIEADDVKVALAVLKGLGLLSSHLTTIEEDDPAVLFEEAELRRREAETQRLFRNVSSVV